MVILMTTSTFAYKCSLDSAIAMRSNEGWTKIPTGQRECIEVLYLSGNNIQKINEGDFDRYVRLENLYIDNCKLETVDRIAFKYLRQLSYIDLSYNRVTYIENDLFRNNTKLAEVVLNGNQLQSHKLSPILISASIQSLKLRNCGIREISSFTFSQLEKLRQLDLSENNILTISDGAFDRNHLDDVCVDPEVLSAPVFSKIRSNALTLNITTYNAAENLCRFYNVQETTDVKKETSTVSTKSIITLQTTSEIQPTNIESSEANTAHISGVTTNSIPIMSVRDQRKAEPEKLIKPGIVQDANRSTTTFEDGNKNDVNVISREKDTNLTEKANNTFGVSIWNGEMYTIMAVSMLVGAGLCYSLIRLCRKRRSNISKRVTEPPPGFVATGPNSTSWMHPVIYRMVPQYELEYPNDTYEIPRTPTRQGFVPPEPLPLPSSNPPLPPRPPRRSVPSYHEYEYISIQSSPGAPYPVNNIHT